VVERICYREDNTKWWGVVVARSIWKTSVSAFPTYYRDPKENEKGQLFEALAAVANISNDMTEYQKLKLKYPIIWPMKIQDGSGEKLRWAPEAFDLLLLYRDLLRLVWNWPRDPDNSQERHKKRQALQILMGIWDFERVLDDEIFPMDMPSSNYRQVWKKIRSHVPEARPGSVAWIYPSWPSGQFVYREENPFQAAVYSLFRESWRARICRTCQQHFVADKQQRQYCSNKCAGEGKRRNDLEWWRRTHTKQSRSQKKRGQR
jgi:hypothetical protein